MTVMPYDGPAVGLMLAFALGWVPAVVAGISALASIWTAHKNASAAKEAANIQVAGTKDAQGYIDRGYAEGKAAFQPWLSTGGAAATTLGNLMGLGGGGGGAVAAPPITSVGTPTAKPLSAWDSMTPEERAYVGSATTRRNTKNYLLTGDESLDPSTHGLFAPDAPTNPQSAAQVQTQSSYVQMKAPDGSVQPVPSQYVKHYTDLGATVVG